MSNLTKTEKKREKINPVMYNNVLASYEEENSRNENSASRENAGGGLGVCTGSSEAAWNPTDRWSKDGGDVSIGFRGKAFRGRITSVLSHSPPQWLLLSEKSDSELVDLSFSNFFLAFVGLLPSGSETGHLFEAEKLRN